MHELVVTGYENLGSDLLEWGNELRTIVVHRKTGVRRNAICLADGNSNHTVILILLQSLKVTHQLR